MKDKVILVDCDGVLFDWEYAFGQWMHRHGYIVKSEGNYLMDVKYGLEKREAKKLIRMFNESAWIRKLPPLRDAIKYVKKLHTDHGYVFHAITSLSDDVYSQHLRTKNLIEMFGPSVFEKYVYLDTGADKDGVLINYEGTNCYWVEDKPENADVGIDFGLNSLLMHHEHNKTYAGDATRVHNWKDIYEIITGE
jgi:beta-phosphoglucomutase-like phosphatase (HAD superfamily)